MLKFKSKSQISVLRAYLVFENKFGQKYYFISCTWDNFNKLNFNFHCKCQWSILSLYDRSLPVALKSYWLQTCPYYNSRNVIFDRKLLIWLATGIFKVYPVISNQKLTLPYLKKLSYKLTFGFWRLREAGPKLARNVAIDEPVF